MSTGPKLPVVLQLVGLTTVLVFSVCAVTTISYAQAILRQWPLIDPMSRTWESFYIPIFSLPVLYGLLSITSAVMFLVLFEASRQSVFKASLAYLAVMFVAATWLAFRHFPSGDLAAFRLASAGWKITFFLHAFYGICLAGLSWAVWSELARTTKR